MNDRHIAIGVIILCTGVVQIHSIPFWIEFSGNLYSGIAFSVALEVCTLWRWYKYPHRRNIFLNVLAAALLISGPCYQISKPVFQRIGTVSTSADLAKSYTTEVAQLEASLSKYEENSSSHKRASDRIDPTLDALSTAREQQRAALVAADGEAKEKGTPSRLYAVAGIEASAFLVIMITQISTTISIRRKVEKNSERRHQRVSAISEKAKKYDEIIKHALIEKLADFKTAAAFCNKYNLSERDVSNVRNGHPISRKMRADMAEKLGC